MVVKKRRKQANEHRGPSSRSTRKASLGAEASKVGAVSLRILRDEGARRFVDKALDKLRKREFRILDDRTTGVRRGRYTSSGQSARNTEVFRAVYENMLSAAVNPPPRGEKLFGNSCEGAAYDVKLIAFYLPQFHPIPENDLWRGRGYTEWTNVSKAVPQFAGHYQPRLPGELGYYDLRLVEIQSRQIELARRYGIYGFCFYYYWFDGKRLLEQPLNQFLSHQELDLPFCICWVNQNWTRRADGGNNDILMTQTYSSGWQRRFIADVVEVLNDRRYVRIGNRPLLIIYNPSTLPSSKEVLREWRAYVRKRGIEDLYIVGAQTFGLMDPRPFGFDAAVEFPPHKVDNIQLTEITREMQLLNRSFSGKVYDYGELVEKQLSRQDDSHFDLFLGVMTGWDNEPRRPSKGIVYAFSTPQGYSKWLRYACERTISHMPSQKRFVFINAWNEWGEGAYLEPDRKFGYGYLEATRAALQSFKTREKS